MTELVKPENGWEAGAMYRIHYRSQKGNYRWYCMLVQMQYIGENHYTDELIFSLRPIAGTQHLDPKNVMKVEKLRKDAPMRSPHSIGEIRKPT